MSHKTELTCRIEADGIVVGLMASLVEWLTNTVLSNTTSTKISYI